MIRVVLAGYGPFGRVYARRVVEHADFDLVGVVDNDEAVRALAYAQTGLPVFDKLSEAIDAVAPAMVLVATHEASHADLCAFALGRGCHVMTAKPGATSFAGAIRLMNAATVADRSLIVDWTPMHMSGWARVREYAAEIGTIQTVRFSRRGWATPRECGPLWDLCPHDVALALNLDTNDVVTGVFASAWGTGVHLTLAHLSGKVSRIECDYTSTHRDRSVEVIGADGTVEWLVDEPSVASSIRDAPVLVPDVPDAITKHLSRVARVLRGDEADDQDMLLQVCRVLEAAANDLRALESEQAQIRGLAVAA